MTTLFFSGNISIFPDNISLFPSANIIFVTTFIRNVRFPMSPFNKAGRHRAWNNWGGRRRKSPCLKVIVPVCSCLFCCSVFLSLKDCCRCLTDFAQLYLLHWAFRNYKEAAARHGQGMWYVKSWGYLLVVLVVSLSVPRTI